MSDSPIEGVPATAPTAPTTATATATAAASATAAGPPAPPWPVPRGNGHPPSSPTAPLTVNAAAIPTTAAAAVAAAAATVVTEEGEGEEDGDDDDDDDFLFAGAHRASLSASGAFSSVGSAGSGGFGLGATRLVSPGGGRWGGGGGGASSGVAAAGGSGGGDGVGDGGGGFFGRPIGVGSPRRPGGASFLDDSDAGTDSDDEGGGFGGDGGGGGGTYGAAFGNVALSGGGSGRRRPFRPQTVKHFILGDVLGEGSYAKVVEGIDSRSLRIVAVKVVDLRFLRKIRGGPENLKREVAIMKALKKHPNIIELIDVIDDERKDKKYIVLELANGCNLQELLLSAPDSRIPACQMKPLLRQLMRGLSYIHDRNVVHRDIKPANIMLTSRSELKVSDFGVAEFLDKYVVTDSVSRTSGTPAFQAPEIASGAADYSGRKVDVWAAGVTLYYCLTGVIPFEASTLMGMFTKISAGAYTVPPALDAGAADLLSGMLTVDFEDRLSVEAVLAHPWLADDEPVVAPDGSPQPRRVPQPCRASRILNIVSAMYEDDGDDGDGGGGGGGGGGAAAPTNGVGGTPSRVATGSTGSSYPPPAPAAPGAGAAAASGRPSLDRLPRPAVLNSVVPDRCTMM